MKNMIFALVFLFCCPVFGQGEITKVYSPQEVSVEVNNSKGIPKELEGLSWNRWTSKNFVVCSLNDIQAQYLHKHLELVKVWAFSRWGLPDHDFPTQCKLICVDDKDLYRKLFNLERTKVEIRRDDRDKIKETVIFLLIDGPPSQTVPIPLTEICLAEFCQKNNVKFNLWTYKGMSNLNGSMEQIRSRVVELKSHLDENDPLFFSKGIMELEASQYTQLSEEKKRLYDNCCTMFCLMIRKEFGQDVYLNLIKEAPVMTAEEAIKSSLKFESYDKIDRTFKRFMIDLSNDVVDGKTPDSYLQIKEKTN
jgi:hypothetical protein